MDEAIRRELWNDDDNARESGREGKRDRVRERDRERLELITFGLNI